jgi:signal transduction histidine kinase
MKSLGARLLVHFALCTLLYAALIAALGALLPEGRSELDRRRLQAATDRLRDADDRSPLTADEAARICSPFRIDPDLGGPVVIALTRLQLHVRVKPAGGLILLTSRQVLMKGLLLGFGLLTLALACVLTLRYADRLLELLRQAAAASPRAGLDATRHTEIAEAASALAELSTRTLQRQRELEERRSQIEWDNRLRDEILQRVRHELQPEIDAIVALLDTLDAQDRLRHLGPRLRTLLSDLADVESPSLKVELERINLTDQAEHAVATLGDQNRRVHIQAPSEPLFILADRVRLEQIVVNLLSNALKASSGTPVELSLGEDEAVWLRVGDQGPGMPPEAIRRLSAGDDAMRAARPLTEQPGSYGLGLIICRRLMELHSGRFLVSSAPGGGTIVEARFPASR